MHAHKLISSIRSKCTPEEAAISMKELPNVYPNGQENGEGELSFYLNFKVLNIILYVSYNLLN